MIITLSYQQNRPTGWLQVREAGEDFLGMYMIKTARSSRSFLENNQTAIKSLKKSKNIEINVHVILEPN